MFSSNKNIEAIEKIIIEVKQYFDLQKKYVLLDLTSKMTIILSALILSIILFLIGMMIILFIGIAGGSLLGQWFDNLAIGYGLIALFFIIIAIIIYAKRNKWITTPLTHFFAKLLIDDDYSKK